MQFVNDDTLERSTVVANCRMNRERCLTGTHGYARDLAFNPLDFLTNVLTDHGQGAWLDLCCGTGRALIEAAERVQTDGLASRVEIVGVDLVGLFDEVPASGSSIFI